MEAKHYYSPWFLRTSLDNDYGSFVCDKCNREFYHSPSTITYGVDGEEEKKQIYNCCCGHCTNLIIYKDWCSTPYE